MTPTRYTLDGSSAPRRSAGEWSSARVNSVTACDRARAEQLGDQRIVRQPGFGRPDVIERVHAERLVWGDDGADGESMLDRAQHVDRLGHFERRGRKRRKRGQEILPERDDAQLA